LFQFDLAQNAVNNLTAVYGTQYAVGSTTGLLCKLFCLDDHLIL